MGSGGGVWLGGAFACLLFRAWQQKNRSATTVLRGGSCRPKRFCSGNAWFDFIELVLYIDFLVADVDVVLEIEEIAVADAEILAEAKGCVHGDLAFVAQDFLDARYRHMDVFRQPVRRNPHRLHELLPEDFRHGRRWNHIFHVDHLLVNDNLQSVRHRNGCHCPS